MIKLIDILHEIESNKILIPRRPKERYEKLAISTQDKIQQYIKDGSKGNLNISGAPITSLPNNLLKVGGEFNMSGTLVTSLPDNLSVEGTLALPNDSLLSYIPNNLKVEKNIQTFGDFFIGKTEELRKMIEDKGGYVKGSIFAYTNNYGDEEDD